MSAPVELMPVGSGGSDDSLYMRPDWIQPPNTRAAQSIPSVINEFQRTNLAKQEGDRQAQEWNERMKAITAQRTAQDGYSKALASGVDPKTAWLTYFAPTHAGPISASMFQPAKQQLAPGLYPVNSGSASVPSASAAPAAEAPYVPNSPQTGAVPPILTPPAETQGATPEGYMQVPGTGSTYVGPDGKSRYIEPKYLKKDKPDQAAKWIPESTETGPAHWDTGKGITQPKTSKEDKPIVADAGKELNADKNYQGLVKEREEAWKHAQSISGDVDDDKKLEAAQDYQMADERVKNYEKSSRLPGDGPKNGGSIMVKQGQKIKDANGKLYNVTGDGPVPPGYTIVP